MKIEDISKIMDNVDARHVNEAIGYRPKKFATQKIIAIAACLAILVTSIPMAFMLSKEDTLPKEETKTTSQTPGATPVDPEKDDSDAFYYQQMNDIKIGDDSIVFNTQFLTDGKNYYVNLEKDTRPLDFDFKAPTALQLQAIFNNTLKFAKYYHDREVIVPDENNYIGTFKVAKYSFFSTEDSIVTKAQYVVNENATGAESVAFYIKGAQVLKFTEDNEKNQKKIYDWMISLERYFGHVLGVYVLPDPSEINISVQEASEDSAEYSLGVTHKMTVTIALDPSQNEQRDQISMTFCADSSSYSEGRYYLSEITTEYSLSAPYELIDEETALKWLVTGKCIGNVGQMDDGCLLCCIKGGLREEDLIPKGLKCSLVYLPDVVFVSGDKSYTYNMPFYAFTVPTEVEGRMRVAYVPAIELSGLNDLLSAQNRADCVYRDHSTNKIVYREDYSGRLSSNKKEQ